MRPQLIALLVVFLAVFLPQQAGAVGGTCTVGGVPYTLNDPTILDVTSCNFTGSVMDSVNPFKVMSATFCVIRAAMGQAMFQVYCNIVIKVMTPFKALLVLYVAIYSLAVMMQVTNGKDWAIRLVKVSLIATMALNPIMFYDYLYSFFVHSVPDGISYYLFNVNNSGTDFATIAGSTAGDKRVGILNNLDTMFNRMVGGGNIAGFGVLMVALLLSVVGAFLILPLLLALGMAIVAFIRITIAYATSLIALNFILMFAPFFLAFLLFNATNQIFYGWMRNVITYSLEMALVLFFLFLLGDLTSLSSTLNQTVQARVTDLPGNAAPAAPSSTTVAGPEIHSDCPIVIGDVGFAQAISFVMPCFATWSGLMDFLYKMFFYVFTFFVSSALMFCFMGKVSPIVQNLSKFNSPVSTAPSVIPGSASTAGGITNMEQAFKGAAAPVWNPIVDKVFQKRGAAGGEDPLKKMQEGMEKMEEGAKKTEKGMMKMKDSAESAKETAEGLTDTAKSSAKAAQKGAEAAYHGGKAAGHATAGVALIGTGAVTSAVTLGADGGSVIQQGMEQMQQAATETGEAVKAAGEAAVEAGNAATSAAKTVGSAAKTVKEGTSGAIEAGKGVAEMGSGALEASKAGAESMGKGGEKGGAERSKLGDMLSLEGDNTETAKEEKKEGGGDDGGSKKA